MWNLLFQFVISALISYVLSPKPPKPADAQVGQIEAPKAEEGSPIPVVFGTVTVTQPNVVWYGDLYVDPITTSSGKK